MQASDRIILALDVGTEDDALKLVRQLTGHVGAFKVGMELLTATGSNIVRQIQDLGSNVFVDLKYHDIPNTAAGAARVLARLGCFMFTVHASGGGAMMQAVADAVRIEASEAGKMPPITLAVTVLTSIDQQQLETDLMIPGMSVGEVALKFARTAQRAGIDGVICSPHEIEAIRAAFGPEFKIVTPGIRPAWFGADDQRRIMTPSQAVKLGADYIVIGRPITASPDPAAAARAIADEIAEV